MNSTYNFTHTIIEIQYKKQKPSDIIYLESQLAVVLFNSACLVYSLHNKSIHKLIQLNNHNIKSGGTLIPYKNNKFCIYRMNLYIIDFQKEQLSVKVLQVENNTLIKYFLQSQQIFLVNNRQGRTYFKTIEQQADQLFIQNSNQARLQVHADAQKLITTSFSNRIISVLDLKAEEIIKFTIPEPLQIQTFKYCFNFYVVNKQVALYGELRDSIFILHEIDFLTQKQKQLLRIQDIFLVVFNTIDKVNSLIVFSIVQKKSPDYKIKLAIFNYLHLKMVWCHQIQDPRINNLAVEFQNQITKRMSKDLKHYIQLSAQGNKTKLMYYRQSNSKKKYFHVFNKSRLFEYYGETLGRYLIKVLF